MTPNEFQQNVMRTANSGLSERDELCNAVMGVAGEAGEYVDLIKKHLWHGHELDKDKAKKELGDIAFYVAWAANCHGFTLEEVLVSVIEKLKVRYPNGFSKADSLVRRDVEG